MASKRTNIQFELGRLERKITNLETQCQTREAQKSSDDQRNRHLESIIRSREEELQTLIREAELLAKSESDALDRLQAQRCKNKTLEAAILDQVYRSVACDQEAQAIYRHIRQMEEASTELVCFYFLFLFSSFLHSALTTRTNFQLLYSKSAKMESNRISKLPKPRVVMDGRCWSAMIWRRNYRKRRKNWKRRKAKSPQGTGKSNDSRRN